MRSGFVVLSAKTALTLCSTMKSAVFSMSAFATSEFVLTPCGATTVMP